VKAGWPTTPTLATWRPETPGFLGSADSVRNDGQSDLRSGVLNALLTHNRGPLPTRAKDEIILCARIIGAANWFAAGPARAAR
jgi:hypothetical protein